MSDQGFDFQPPLPRREPRGFNPPPWERDQFEQQERERVQQERAEKEQAARAKEARREDGLAETNSDSAGPGLEASGDGMRTAPPSTAGEPAAGGELDEALVEHLMLGLRAEEPPSLGSLWLVMVSAGIVLGLVGLALGVWGVAAMLNPAFGGMGKIGGTVMLVLCAAFVGGGAWMSYRALRQRGVL